MKFNIEAIDSAARGLRVISDIPDIELCRIEGRNGIGKTLAARLLELASGVQPFAALPHAWNSLVEGLGKVNIRIEGFEDGAIIECQFESSSWAGRDLSECASNPGDVLLNGHPIGWDEARRRFQVRRIAGDEGLQETLGRLTRERAIEAERHAERLAGRLKSWGPELGNLQSLAGQMSAPALLASRTTATDARARWSSLKQRQAELAGEISKLEERASGFAGRADSLELLPELLAEYRSHRSQLEDALEAASKELEQLRLAALNEQQDASTAAKLSHWQHLLQYRERALSRARSDRSYWARVAGVTEGTPRSELSSELSRRREQIEREIETGYVAGSLRKVVADVGQPLERLGENSIVQQDLVFIDRPVSAFELRGALRTRAAELEGVPKPERVRELETELDTLKRRIAAVSYMPQLDRAVERKQELVDEALNALESLVGSQSEEGGTSSTLRRLGESREALTSASSESGRLAFAIAGLIGAEPQSLGIAEDLPEDDEDTEPTDEQIESIPAGTGLPTVEAMESLVENFVADAAHSAGFVGSQTAFPELIVRLRDASTDALIELDSKRDLASEIAQDVRRAEQESLAASEQLASVRLLIRTAVATIQDPNGRWTSWKASFDPLFERAGSDLNSIARALNGEDESVDLEQAEESACEGLAAIGNIAAQIEESAAQNRLAWNTISSYLEATARQLAPRLSGPNAANLAAFGANVAEPILREWTESELASVLSTEALRRELFDDAEVVSIDLASLAVQWKTATGQRRRRPLEAFSSGEQVFAYTRAKLDQYQDLFGSAERTTIFLDEFGAFVARDRFGQLMRYVEDEAIGKISDQIVVMLPWSGAIPSSLRPKLAQDASESLERRGYFAVSGMAGGR